MGSIKDKDERNIKNKLVCLFFDMESFDYNNRVIEKGVGFDVLHP